MYREFPGDLVVRILGFHCRGLGSVLAQGTEILQAVWCGQKKKKRERIKKKKRMYGNKGRLEHYFWKIV